MVRGLLLLAGYSWGLIRGLERPVSPERWVHRREQMQRLQRGYRGPSDGLDHPQTRTTVEREKTACATCSEDEGDVSERHVRETMSTTEPNPFNAGPNDPILVTEAAGFIGPAVVQSLLSHGFRNLRAFVRASSDIARLNTIVERHGRGARRRDQRESPLP